MRKSAASTGPITGSSGRRTAAARRRGAGVAHEQHMIDRRAVDAIRQRPVAQQEALIRIEIEMRVGEHVQQRVVAAAGGAVGDVDARVRAEPGDARAAPIDAAGDLGVQGRHVQRLRVHVHRELPVAGERHDHVGGDAEAAERAGGELVGQRRKELVDRLRRRREGHPDEAEALGDSQRHQVRRRQWLDVRRRHERAVERVAPRVVRAAQARRRADAVREPRPAMDAGVGEGAQRPLLAAHDQRAAMPEVEDGELPRTRQPAGVLGEQPAPSPQSIALEGCPGGVGPALDAAHGPLNGASSSSSQPNCWT